MLKSIHHHLEGVSDLSPTDVANHVNTAFLAPTEHLEPLTYNPFRDSSVPSLDNSASDEVLVVSELSVLQKLSTRNTTKAQGPDGIPGWLLKDNADLLTESVTEIPNISYFENCLPSSWKEADVVPVPK